MAHWWEQGLVSIKWDQTLTSILIWLCWMHYCFCFDYVIMRLVGQFNMHYKLCLTSIEILIVYKDEMVVRLSHLYNGNSCIGKMIFSYWIAPWLTLTNCSSMIVWFLKCFSLEYKKYYKINAWCTKCYLFYRPHLWLYWFDNQSVATATDLVTPVWIKALIGVCFTTRGLQTSNICASFN